MRIALLLYLLAALFFAGCSSSKEIELYSEKELPAWYKTPPLSNSATLYATGEGKDKKEAIANALNYMASTLSVSIESTYRAQTTVHEGSVDSKEGLYTSDISSNVQKIRISNYSVVESASLGFRSFAVLLSSDKGKLYQSLKTELDQKIELANAKEKNLNGDGLQSYLFYKELQQENSSVQNTLLVMKELHSSFDNTPYLDFLKSIEKKYNICKEQLSFSVETNFANLNSSVAKALTKKGFSVKSSASKYHYQISIEATVKQAQAYGFDLARAEIKITTKDEQGTQLASNIFHLTGQSSQGYGLAKQDLVRQLNLKIKKEGIERILNLNI